MRSMKLKQSLYTYILLTTVVNVKQLRFIDFIDFTVHVLVINIDADILIARSYIKHDRFFFYNKKTY